MRLYDFLSWEGLDFAFSDVDEDLERDISAVHVLCNLDSHFGAIDFSIDVYGLDGIDSLPVFSEAIPVETGEVISGQLISPLFVVSMFDERIRKLFAAKGLSILYNPDWATSAAIDPLYPDPSLELLPEEH